MILQKQLSEKFQTWLVFETIIFFSKFKNKSAEGYNDVKKMFLMGGEL